MNAIESHRWRGALIACALWVACASPAPAPPPTASPPPPTTASPAPEAKPAARPPAVKTPKRAVRAPAPTDGLHLLRTSGSVEGPITYLVVEPADAPPDAPLVFALHGRGDKAERFARLIERLRLPIRFIVADGPMPWGARAGRRWFDMKSPELAAQLTQRVTDLVTLSDAVAKRWPTAPAPSLLGFSQGAMLAIHAIAQRPDRFAGAVALSGAMLVTEGMTTTTTPRPVLLSAGESDKVVPPERSKAAATALQALGHQVELFTFQEGHTVTGPVIKRIREVLLSWHSATH